MKLQPTSFPFFFLVSILIIMAAPTNGFAQTTTDSSRYYYNAVIHPHIPEDIPKGIAYYTSKKDRDLANEDTLAAIESLRLISSGYYKIGNYYDSEEVATEALRLLQSLKDTIATGNARIGIYNQLGLLYRNLENHAAALALYDSALAQTPPPAERNILLNNKANLYKDLVDYTAALEQYRNIADGKPAQTNPLQYARVLDNMGYVMAQIQSPSGLDSLQKAMQIREKYQDLPGLYSSYKNMALYHYERNLPIPALSFAKQAQQTANDLNSASYRYDALQLLALLKGDPDVAEYRRLTDSLNRARQLAENKNAYIKYNLSEERKKTAEQALQKERAQRSRQLFQLSTAAIFIILVLSYFVLRSRYRKGKQEIVYKTESRISKKVHDELANDLFNVLAFAENRPLEEPVEKEKLLSSLDALYGKTRDISKDTAQVPTGTGFPRALKELLAGFSSQKVNVIIQGIDTLPWNRISDLKKMACFRVLQELLVNMKKHSGASLVLLKFAREGKKVHISYTDNGIGLAPDSQLDRGGLRIVENRIDAIKGRFTFDPGRNQGFRCTVSFPI